MIEPSGSTVDTLIVGAGPTGLILAHELLRRGLNCRLVEKRATPAGSTRAFTLHARTMEMFDHMGIAERIDELREICPGNQIHFKGLVGERPDTKLDFTRLPGTRYNYYGKVNQNDLDKALRESLAAKYDFRPEFGLAYVASSDSQDGVTATLRRDGERADEIVHASWLIGADGSNSAVRATLGVSFEQDGADTMTMSMVDVKLKGFKGDRAWVNYYVSDKGFLLVTGLPGDKFRLYLAGALEHFLDEGTPQEAFQRGLDFFDTGARISHMDWSSSWVIRKIVCDEYFAGRTILCGDATHVHSPAGGQGMNACMQDAFNLGWKIALMVKGRASDGVLETYRDERRPIAEQVTKGAQRMHQVLFDASIPIEQRFSLTQDPGWHDETILRISALSHNYRGIDGLAAGLVLGPDDIQPGDRAPDCELSRRPPKRRLYDIFRHPGFTLLILPGTGAGALKAAVRKVASMEAAFGPVLKVAVVAPREIDGLDYDHLEIDESGELANLYGEPAGGQMVLVRPDLYVGFRGSLDATEALRDYLAKWLLMPVPDARQPAAQPLSR